MHDPEVVLWYFTGICHDLAKNKTSVKLKETMIVEKIIIKYIRVFEVSFFVDNPASSI